jgi:hypothetical protein
VNNSFCPGPKLGPKPCDACTDEPRATVYNALISAPGLRPNAVSLATAGGGGPGLKGDCPSRHMRGRRIPKRAKRFFSPDAPIHLPTNGEIRWRSYDLVQRRTEHGAIGLDRHVELYIAWFARNVVGQYSKPSRVVFGYELQFQRGRKRGKKLVQIDVFITEKAKSSNADYSRFPH